MLFLDQNFFCGGGELAQPLLEPSSPYHCVTLYFVDQHCSAAFWRPARAAETETRHVPGLAV